MSPLALIGSVKSLPWKLIGAVAGTLTAVGVVWWQVHQYGERREQFGRDAEIAADAQADAVATANHDAKIDQLNEVHYAQSQDLSARLQTALDKPPAVRVVRVPVGATCPAEVARDAGEPERTGAIGGPIGAGETDYLRLRNAVLQLGADAEKWRRAVLDAQAGWPKAKQDEPLF